VGRINTAKKYAGDDEMTTVMPRKILHFPSRAEQEREEAIARILAARDQRVERHLEREVPELREPKSSREPRRDTQPPASSGRENRKGIAPRVVVEPPPAAEERKRNTPIPPSRVRRTSSPPDPVPSEAREKAPDAEGAGLALPSVFKPERSSAPPVKAAPAKLQVDTAPAAFAPSADASGKRRRVSLPSLPSLPLLRAPEDGRGWAMAVSASLSALGLIFVMGMVAGRFGLFSHRDAGAGTPSVAAADIAADTVTAEPPAPPPPREVAPPAAMAPAAGAVPCIPTAPAALADKSAEKSADDGADKSADSAADKAEKGDATKPPAPESAKRVGHSRPIHRVPAPAPSPSTFRSGGVVATMPKHAPPAAPKRPAAETAVASVAPPAASAAARSDEDLRAAAAADKLAKAQLEAAFR
jgi:hypothetical protein